MVLPPDTIWVILPLKATGRCATSLTKLYTPWRRDFTSISSIFVGSWALHIDIQPVFFLPKIASLPVEMILKCLQMLHNWVKVILLPHCHEDYEYELRTKWWGVGARKLKNRKGKEIFILFFNWCRTVALKILMNNEQMLHCFCLFLKNLFFISVSLSFSV